ncbi:patatin-like phospholipase family protein [Actinomarinicola tropica]|uniref:Patatin-like phospholipase family protein n=1 Tax=Actinomarinicola tropica TaxID=2789776 RepID=A0A5Q2RF94_9ACTN|nr:patatin-like phospholipase family protein [Actinomarinicola tropica]QGG94304.1 patatin-like phospholipase family protein [Actinomarinicola tropica]
MTRALVLGGGGPVGIAWESGLVVGLAERGIDLSVADRILGTSAGSNVGARLALGHDLSTVAQARSTPQRSESDAVGGPMGDRLAGLMEVMAQAMGHEGTPEEARALIGRFALDADPMPEERFTGVFADLADQPWPAAFACTAIRALTGELVVWDADAGVDLHLAVSSSCSVPGIFPPITIDGERYIDGGMRSALNADLVAGADRAVVVSVMPTSMAGFADVGGELAALRGSGTTVEVVEPDEAFLELAGMGAHLMDLHRGPQAYELGLALADQVADRVGVHWGG